MAIKRITFGLSLNESVQKKNAEYLRNLAGSNRQNILRLLLIIGSSAERRNAESRGDTDG